jgi:hypothetical protein
VHVQSSVVGFSFQNKKFVRIYNGLPTYHTFIPDYFNWLDEGGLFKVFVYRDFQFCPFYSKRSVWTIFHQSPISDFIKILSVFLGYFHAYGKMEECRDFNKCSAWMYLLLRAFAHLPTRVKWSTRNRSILKRVHCEFKGKRKRSTCNLPWRLRGGVDSSTLSLTTALEWVIEIFFIFKFKNKYLPNVIVAVKVIVN